MAITTEDQQAPVVSLKESQVRQIENALKLFEVARADVRAAQEKLTAQQAELVEILEEDFDGKYVMAQQGPYPRRTFTVVRAHDIIEHRDEQLVLSIAKRFRMFKRFTRLAVDWDAVRKAIDSGVFPELAETVHVEKKPKTPYINIS